MAGVPPLVGFFAKYTVLYSAVNNGYAFLAIVAILASVVSAVYYLRIIRVIHFGDSVPHSSKNQQLTTFENSQVRRTVSIILVVIPKI